MSADHYENFPVASVLLPRRLVPAVEAIYAFARSADDIADEGDATSAERLAALEHYEASLTRIERGQASEGDLEHRQMIDRLAGVIAQHGLPLAPFHDLLSAFKQDVVTTSYADFASLLNYCQRSANPVGRLMLQLYDAADTVNVRDADAICSALQLINFLQDVAIDLKKGRIYLPQEDLVRFGVTPAALENALLNAQWHALMRFELARARALMLSGSPLARRLPGRIGWELRLVVQGGLRIVERIAASDCDIFTRRPQLQKRDWVVILWRAWRM